LNLKKLRRRLRGLLRHRPGATGLLHLSNRRTVMATLTGKRRSREELANAMYPHLVPEPPPEKGWWEQPADYKPKAQPKTFLTEGQLKALGFIRKPR
jgi:hypothetical protein